MSAYIKEMTSS